MSEYVIEGQRLVCKDIVLTLQRILYFKPTEPPQSGPHTVMPVVEDMQLLDGSGAFILEACVRIDDRTKPTLVQSATEELNWVKNELKGSVDLRTPERLALDTRVKDSI